MSDFDGVISKDMMFGAKSPNLRAPLIGTPNRAVCASRLVGRLHAAHSEANTAAFDYRFVVPKLHLFEIFEPKPPLYSHAD